MYALRAASFVLATSAGVAGRVPDCRSNPSLLPGTGSIMGTPVLIRSAAAVFSAASAPSLCRLSDNWLK